MTDHASRTSRVESSHTPSTGAAAHGSNPGKQTLVESALTAPVQRHAAPGPSAATGEAGVHAAAAQGVATPSSALPHGDHIQRLFGRHDISGVQAHTGDGAAASARAMGADAYATGNHVVLGKGGDLFTEAHEAAHVVQQRGGVQLKGGVGAVGDQYEQHADEVAGQVVQGKSVEGLLDRYAGGSASAAAGAGPVQHRITVGATLKDQPTGSESNPMEVLDTQADVNQVWAQFYALPALHGVDEAMAKAVLLRWTVRPVPDRTSNDQSIQSEDRKYRNRDELAAAVAGEVRSSNNVAKEAGLAERTLSAAQIQAGVDSFAAKLVAFHRQHEGDEGLETTEQVRGRYAGWAYGTLRDKVGTTLQAMPTTTSGRIAFIADYALAAKNKAYIAAGKTKRDWVDKMNQGMTAEMNDGRATHHNTDETSPWVIAARGANAPLSAGPSATTAQVLTLATAIGATAPEMEALAWALFGIWNTMPTHQTGTHRFHEVMSVAANYGVPYTRFEYTEPPASPGGNQ